MKIGEYQGIKNCVIYTPEEFKELQEKILAQRELICEFEKVMNI